jgi:hypothetical protein
MIVNYDATQFDLCKHKQNGNKKAVAVGIAGGGKKILVQI